jgi:hypothetical protein
MEKKNFNTLGNILTDFVKTIPNSQQELDIVRVHNLWKDVVGTAICDSTTEMIIDKNIIFLKFDNPIAKNEVLLMKHSILMEINNKIGRKMLTQMIVR